MRKNRIWIMLLAMLALLMAFTCAQAEEKEDAPIQFRFPASLQIIEEEAFEGTSIVIVDLPESVEEIGDRAFAEIETLKGEIRFLQSLANDRMKEIERLEAKIKATK